MDKPLPSLIVTAHPDDETIFFAGLILSRPKANWRLICVTDGNADGQGERRSHQLHEASKKLGIESVSQFSFPDTFEKRLPITELKQKLMNEECKEVFTHGPFGEYGHPHHQDVCYATHLSFKEKCKIYSIAHNCLPDFSILLDEANYKQKCEIFSQTYFSETQRFYQMLPSHWHEGFCELDFNEVEAIYNYFAKGEIPKLANLKRFQWLKPYLSSHKKPAVRPF